MITKPTSLSPVAETISIPSPERTITLSAQILSGSSLEMIDDDYCYGSIILNADGTTYVLVCDTDVTGADPEKGELRYVRGKVERGKTSIKVSFDLDVSVPSNITGGTTEHVSYLCLPTSQSSYAIRWSDENAVMLGDLLTNGVECSWKVRLFDNGSLNGSSSYRSRTKVAYGSISGCERYTYSGSDYCRVTVFPHTTIYSRVIVGDDEDTSSRDHNVVLPDGSADPYGYIRQTIRNSVFNADPNMRYYLEVNGRSYPIVYYSYVPLEEGAETAQEFEWDDYFDTYGNPINGYCVVKVPDGFSFDENDNYVIYCNFIDSKNTYFDIYEEPTILLYDSHENNTGDIGHDLSQYNNIGNPYVIDYCNLDIDIVYRQSDGITSNYYSYRIYLYNELTNDFELVFGSNNMYNQELECYYDRFLPDRIYRIDIEIIDTQRRSFQRSLFVKTNYSFAQTNIKATVDYYNPHNSVIVDWSQVESILPDDIDPDSYTYVNLSDSGKITDATPHNAVLLQDDQFVTYTKDNYGNDLDLKGVTIGIAFTGTLLTDGIIAWWSTGDGSHVLVSYTNGSIVVRSTEYSYIFDLYENYTQDELISAFRSETISPSAKRVPFIWGDKSVGFDTMTWDDSYFWHEDSLIAEKEIHGLEGSIAQKAVSTGVAIL